MDQENKNRSQELDAVLSQKEKDLRFSLRKLKASSGGDLTDADFRRTSGEIFSPIFDEFQDLDEVFDKVEKITKSVKEALLGLPRTQKIDDSLATPDKIVNNDKLRVENEKVVSLKEKWIDIREKYKEIKLVVEECPENRAERDIHKKSALDLRDSIQLFFKDYEIVKTELIGSNDKESLEDSVFTQGKTEVKEYDDEIKRWVKFLESEKKELWMIELDEFWESINRKPDQRTTHEVLKDEVEDMRRILPENLDKKSREFFEQSLLIRDVAILETKSEGAGRHMCWQNAQEDRKKIMPYIKTNEMRDRFINSEFLNFKEMPEVFSYLRETVFSFHPEKDFFVNSVAESKSEKFILKKFEELGIDQAEVYSYVETVIFGTNPINDPNIRLVFENKLNKWNDDNPTNKKKLNSYDYFNLGNPKKEKWIPTVEELILARFPILKKEPSFIPKFFYSRSWNNTHPNGEKKGFASHNYAKLGNPDISTADWIPNVSEILLERFPELKKLPNFILDAIVFSITVTEMRMDGFYPLYDAYIASPITHVDVEALFPWGAVGLLDYKAGGYGGIPGYLGLFAAMQWPSCPPNFDQSNIKNRVTSSRSDEPYSYEKMGRDTKEGDWLTFEKENAVFQKLRPFQDMDHFGKKDWWKREGMMVLDYGSDATRRGKALENRAKAVVVRNFLRIMLSPSAGYDAVEINPDMKILPSPYDAFIGEFRGKKFEMSIPDLINIYEVFDKFMKRVGDGPGKTFESVDEIMKDLNEVVGVVAKFKQMSKLGESQREIFADFLSLTNVLFSIYIRKLFINFVSLPTEKKTAFYQAESNVLIKQNIITTKISNIRQSLQSDRELFLKRAIDLIKSSTTLPTSIQLYFTAKTETEIKDKDGWNKKGIFIQALEQPVGQWGRFFNPTAGEYSSNNLKMWSTFKVKFPEMAAFAEKWLNPPANIKDKKE